MLRLFNYSTRLPGPLAAHILASDGAEVIACDQFKDPFQSATGQIYEKWFHAFRTHHIKTPSSKELKEVHLFEARRPIKVPSNAMAVVISSNRPKHDLNQMCEYGLAHLLNYQGTSALPPLPIAGLCFAQAIARKVLTRVIEGPGVTTAEFGECTKAELTSLWDKSWQTKLTERPSFFGSARYAIYQSKDRLPVAVACLEEHYWQALTSALGLSTEANESEVSIAISGLEAKAIQSFNLDCVTV